MDQKYIPRTFTEISWYTKRAKEAKKMQQPPNASGANLWHSTKPTDDQIKQWEEQGQKEDIRKKKIYKKLLLEPDPEIVLVDNTPIGHISLHYHVGIIFDASTLNRGDAVYTKFDPKLHSCDIYRWCPNTKILDTIIDQRNNRIGASFPKFIYRYPDGAYYPWLQHKRSKPKAWKKLGEPRTVASFHQRLMLAHLFFKDEKDFESWMGEHYAGMFTDLL